MIHKEVITCPYCSKTDLKKNGHSENNTQRWLCKSCKRSFQRNYTYNAHKPGVKEQIVELTLNSSGIRDISRVLKISKNTVSNDLKKKRPPK